MFDTVARTCSQLIPYAHTHTHTCTNTHTQGYLKEFNKFFEELKGKNVGLFGVCAHGSHRSLWTKP